MLRNIITVLTIMLASPAVTQDLKPILLKEGANAYETEAINSAMSELIADTFKYYAENFHPFMSSPSCINKTVECRGNLTFNINFKAASVDLDSDEIDEVIVYYNAPGYCGSGGCTSYILAQRYMDNNWVILGKFFPGSRPSISSLMTNGHYDIHHKGKSESYKCQYDGEIYSCKKG